LLRRRDDGLLRRRRACREQPSLSDGPGIAGALSGSLKGRRTGLVQGDDPGFVPE